MCYDDIRDFIANHYSMLKEREIAADSGSISFIEEQCRMQKNLPKFADMYQSSLNGSSQNNDVQLLSDYASFIKGMINPDKPLTSTFLNGFSFRCKSIVDFEG